MKHLNPLFFAAARQNEHKKTLTPLILIKGIFVLLIFIGFAVHAENRPKPLFKLTQGQGTEVCEAYLQRLNATEFLDNDPTKGRVREPLLKGFADLKPVPLTAEEIQRIQYKTLSFERFQDQYLFEKFSKKWDEIWGRQSSLFGHGLIEFPSNTLEAINQDIVTNQKTPFVRYQAQLDMDNDGVAGDVVIKNNRGVYIVDYLLQHIDEERMKRIFADQDALDWPTMYQFPSLAFPITIFGYNNKYYFDGFFNNLFFSQAGSVIVGSYCRSPPYLLGVFTHEHQKTYRICEYEWVNCSPRIN